VILNMEDSFLNYSGSINTQIREFGASTRFKGSKTIYMQLEEEKKKKDES